MKKMFVLVCLIFLPQIFAQTLPPDWEKFRGLEGEWKSGTGENSGASDGSFSFHFQLDGNIFVRKNLLSIPATQYSIEQIHEDLMIIYPGGEEGFYAIYFDNEGHTINYKVSFGERKIVFTSEKKDKNPAFRLTYSFQSEKSVSVKFEYSGDGINFQTYLEGDAIKL